MNILAKTISELNKEEQMVRRIKVTFNLERKVREGFMAHIKFELDLMIK